MSKKWFSLENEQTGKIITRSTSRTGAFAWETFLSYIHPSPTDYSSPLGFGLWTPLCVGAMNDLSNFRPNLFTFPIITAFSDQFGAKVHLTTVQLYNLQRRLSTLQRHPCKKIYSAPPVALYVTIKTTFVVLFVPAACTFSISSVLK